MMYWPDLALHEETDLIFRHPRGEPPEGLVIVKADLTAFFGLVEMVGRNEALLLLLVKALRTRYGPFRLRVYDLAWRMRVGHHRVIRWLDRLGAARLVVYTLQDLLERDTVEVEIVAATTMACLTIMNGRNSRHIGSSMCCRCSDGLPSRYFSTSLQAKSAVRFTSTCWCRRRG